MSSLLAVFSIYIFILMGFVVKKIFKDDIDERTLILISVYFLQPFLTFWGLTRAPIDFNLIYTPFVYFIVITLCLIILMLIGKFAFKDPQDNAIFLATSLVGNTGNLGIPLGIALFGESSVPYTSIINIANVFFIYTMGIYFFARSQFDLGESVKQMFKIPILWFALLALLFNYMEFTIHPQVDLILVMAAYATIVIQLIIFGVYLAKTSIRTHNYKLSFGVSFAKLILVPVVGLIVLRLSMLPNELAMILMVSLFVPLAVNNVNMAALYKCKPYDVTAIVLISTGLFLVLIYFELELLKVIF